MELKDIVFKLVGEITPLGCASRDQQRLENVKKLCELRDDIDRKLEYLLRYKDSYESSVKVIGDYVYKYFMDRE